MAAESFTRKKGTNSVLSYLSMHLRDIETIFLACVRNLKKEKNLILWSPMKRIPSSWKNSWHPPSLLLTPNGTANTEQPLSLSLHVLIMTLNSHTDLTNGGAEGHTAKALKPPVFSNYPFAIEHKALAAEGKMPPGTASPSLMAGLTAFPMWASIHLWICSQKSVIPLLLLITSQRNNREELTSKGMAEGLLQFGDISLAQ